MPSSRKRLETRFIVRNTNGVMARPIAGIPRPTPRSSLGPVWTNLSPSTTVATCAKSGITRSRRCLVATPPRQLCALASASAAQSRFRLQRHGRNQLQALSTAGYFSQPLTNRHLFPHPRFTATNETVSLEYPRPLVARGELRSVSSTRWSSIPRHVGCGLSTPCPLNGIINGPLNNNFKQHQQSRGCAGLAGELHLVPTRRQSGCGSHATAGHLRREHAKPSLCSPRGSPTICPTT